MTKKEYIKELLNGFDTVAKEFPCISGPGTIKKISFTKSSFEVLLHIILNDDHIIWKENGTHSGGGYIRKR